MDRRIRYSSSSAQRPSFLSQKRKSAWSNDIMINTFFFKKLKFNRSQVNSKSGGYRCFLLGTVSFRFALLSFGRIWRHVSILLLPAWGRDKIRQPVDKLWKVDLDYSECNLLTNNNTLERSFHSTEDPGRSWVKLKFPLYLFFGT